jgi:hypothetical protein
VHAITREVGSARFHSARTERLGDGSRIGRGTSVADATASSGPQTDIQSVEIHVLTCAYVFASPGLRSELRPNSASSASAAGCCMLGVTCEYRSSVIPTAE